MNEEINIKKMLGILGGFLVLIQILLNAMVFGTDFKDAPQDLIIGLKNNIIDLDILLAMIITTVIIDYIGHEVILYSEENKEIKLSILIIVEIIILATGCYLLISKTFNVG